MSSIISMKQLLEAGVHFGHQTRRWNPKMAKYIFTERNGIYIIDLQKTVKKVDEAYNFIRETAQNGGSILFVGTKKQAQEAMREEAVRCNQYYINERWLGGMMTNFKTIQKRVARLRQLEKMEEDGTFDVLPKKEVLGLRHEMEKLNKNLGGIKEMVDTNCDPDEVDYVIPANDDAIRAVRLLASKMADAVLEGRQGQQTAEAETADVPAEETVAEAE